MTRQIELLAPAGSKESMIAAIQAGADAIYIGGSRFGARAYADNPGEDALIEAIEYVHLYGKKIYLTVNTLLKEEELAELIPWLKPYYEAGLDAVIVQDMGVLSLVHKSFPDLAIHASTQMTITGAQMIPVLKRYGVTRVVTARELSLEEIREIDQIGGIEIESFVHGALCYCYSGQCLFSSIAGQRSGNRGRCAQPCRLPYQISGGKEAYVLSPKDLNTLAILPEVIEAGVTSLKIEGRMKKPEYTAGVVSIYRKYLDNYLEHGKSGYQVSKEDQKNLFDLFNRSGFTQGYYRKHNGKDMITMEKPSFRENNQLLTDSLKNHFLDTKKKENVNGKVIIRKDFPVIIEISARAANAVITGPIPMKAQNQPLTSAMVSRQLSKTGDSLLAWDRLEIELEDGLFLTVGMLNQLRRDAFRAIEEAIQKPYRRISNIVDTPAKAEAGTIQSGGKPRFSASVETWEQCRQLLEAKHIGAIYLDCLAVKPEQYPTVAKRAHECGKELYLLLPRIFRFHAKRFMDQHMVYIKQAGFDGYVVQNMEEVGYLKAAGITDTIIADHMLYAYNKEAEAFYQENGVDVLTLPVELSAKELSRRGCAGAELIVYGRLPMMVSAQCLQRTVKSCTKAEETLYLKDRKGNQFPVKNFCTFCYNQIYNNKPVSLLDGMAEIKRLNPAALRLIFTTESAEATADVAALFKRAWENPQEENIQINEFTRGHFKRGVE